MNPIFLLIALTGAATPALDSPASAAKAPPAVTRNSVVAIVYRKGPLTLTARGRALGQGAVGDMVRVINLDSRIAIMATVSSEQEVSVQ